MIMYMIVEMVNSSESLENKVEEFSPKVRKKDNRWKKEKQIRFNIQTTRVPERGTEKTVGRKSKK